MLDKTEMMRTFRALEMLYKGQDISKVSLVDSIADDTATFCMQFEDKAKDFAELHNPFVYRNGKQMYLKSQSSVDDEGIDVAFTVTYDMLVATMNTLRKLQLCTFSNVDDDILDPTIAERMKAIDVSWDYTKAYDCDIKNKLKISDTDAEVKAMLALCQYPEGLAPKIYDSYKQTREFVLKDFKDFEVVDNRIIIPLSEADKYRMRKYFKGTKVDDRVLSMNALVISKNPVDYFFCSYGNSFQSCFALNSSMYCWYGYLPYVTTDESFIVYATTGEVMKTAVISGQKFHNPQMLWRSWGYATEDGSLCIDKKYRGGENGIDKLIEFCCEWMTDKFNVICDRRGRAESRALYNKGKGILDIWKTYGLKFYSDSLVQDGEEVCFAYGCGDSVSSEYTPEWKKSFDKFIDWTSTANSVDPLLVLDKPCDIVNGVVTNINICPITKLKIPNGVKQHAYAKYFDKPLEQLAVLTYDKGCVRCDAATREFISDPIQIKPSINVGNGHSGFNGGTLYCYGKSTGVRGTIALKSLKEHIKGCINTTPYSAILLKIIEDDKITCQVFKNKGGN